MLPFLKSRRQSAGIATDYRKPDDTAEPKDDGMAGVEAACEDFFKAYETRDKVAGAKALKAAFEILDSMPHEEGPNEEETE